MERHTLGIIQGYAPELSVNVVDGMFNVRVRGIPERIAKLPAETTEAVVTADGMLFYTLAGGAIYPVVPDQRNRVAEIIEEHDRFERALAQKEAQMKALGAGLIDSQKTTDVVKEKAPVTHIEMRDETLIRMLRSYEGLIDTLKHQLYTVVIEYGSIKDELLAIQKELDSLKALAAQEEPHSPTDPIVEVFEPRSLRDDLTAVPDNPFVRRRP